MSYMSELSIAAATTRNEGPTVLDDLAHRLAHAAVDYHIGNSSAESYTALREMCYQFRAIAKVQDMCASRNLSPRALFDQTAHDLARHFSTQKGRIQELIDLQESYMMISSVVEML